MYALLVDLEEINTNCRIQLTKLLDRRHGIRPEAGAQSGKSCVFFLAFDPGNTCLRFPYGSFRYFDMAELAGLFQPTEAMQPSSALLAHGAELASLYNGRCGAFFATFDPWNTCLRLSHGSFRYFDIAERAGLLQPAEAMQLSNALLADGAELASVYGGCFNLFFQEPRVRTLRRC